MIDIIKESNIPSGWDSDRNGKRWEEYDTIKCPDGQIIDMVKLLDDQDRAKAALVHLSPALGGFISRLRHVYTFKVETQATDGYNILVNPQFTYNLDLTGKCFVMAHEIMHCLLNHMRRGRGHDPQRSNIAADYECNISLVEMGMFKFDTMKKLKAYVDQKYTNWGYEKIYDDCSQHANNSMQNQQGQSQAQQNQQGQQQSGQPQNQQGQSGSGQGSSGAGNQQNQPKSADYKKGWKKAIEDYKKGKLKL